MLSKFTIHGRFLKKAKIVVLAHKISALFQKLAVKAILNHISKTQAAVAALTALLAGFTHVV